MMKKFALITAAVLSLASTSSAQYAYDNSEDWIKLGGGALAGLFTASIVEASSNVCFKNSISAADSAVEYALTGMNDKQTALDWAMWVVVDLGVVIFFSAKAIYYCLGTDVNFGWVKPDDYSNVDLKTVVLSPWTQDFLISLLSVATGLYTAITAWDTVDPYYVSKKLVQGAWGSLLKLIQLLVFKSFGY